MTATMWRWQPDVVGYVQRHEVHDHSPFIAEPPALVTGDSDIAALQR
jgi:hypothetical protein